MVLKRFLTMALGALGLGALASGASFAQTPGSGNIPAPDMFNDQIACVDRVPTGLAGTYGSGGDAADVPQPTKTAMGTTPLKDLITAARGTNGGIDITVTTQDGMGAAEYQDLIYSIPTVDCGTPYNADAQSAPANVQLDGDDSPLSRDVANGYNALKATYDAVHHPVTGTKKGLKDAQAAYDALVKAGTTGTALENAEKALADAKKLDTAATAKLTRETTGSVYKAAVAEWDAKSAVESAVTKFNTAVGTDDANAQGGRSGLRGAEATFTESAYNGKWVQLTLGGTDGIEQLFYEGSDLKTGNALIAAIEAYIEKGENGNGNFNESGALVLPGTSATDNDPDKVASATVTTVKQARDRSEAVRAALVKLQTSNQDDNFTDEITEAVRRATLEAAHYDSEYTRMLGDTTDLDTDANAFDSIAQRYTRYQAAQRTYDTAVTDLTKAVTARENATKAVQAAFSDPTDFHGQAVNRREDLKSAADKLVTDAGSNPPKALVDSAADAQKALDAAKKVQTAVAKAVGDENSPTNPLVTELLKNGGDDGQALVDAIGGTYDTAKDAKATADRVAADVDGLTGEGGQVALNTAAIAENADDIATNATNIATNADNIAANATNIMTNTENIATNADNIMANSGRIDTNAADIMTNAGHIADNTAAIGMNTGAIADLGNRVGSNESAIQRNSGMIGELSESLETVRAGVAASMALAGMPAINGRGVSIGVGSFDGESAFAVGFMIQSEMASFKVGVTSAGGATGASAGVGFQF